MKSLRRRQQHLRRRIRDLIWLLSNGSGERIADDRPEVCYEIALTAAQLSELAPVGRAFFGSTDQVDESHSSSIPNRYASEVFEGAIAHLTSNVLLENSYANGSAEDLVSALISYREQQSVRSLLQRERYLDRPGDRLASWIQSLRSAWLELPIDTRIDVGNALAAYMANQWLYPWAEIVPGHRLGTDYEVLFEIARIPNGGSEVFDSNLTRAILKAANLSDELSESLKRVLEALDRAVSEYGIEALEDILAEGGRPMPNLPGDVGFIPGDGRGPCPRILVGIATTKSPRSKFGSVQVMRKLRDALIRCCDAGVPGRTEVAIFVGPIETIAGIIEESEGDLEGHLRKGVLKVFIPIGVLRNRMNVLAWR